MTALLMTGSLLSAALCAAFIGLAVGIRQREQRRIEERVSQIRPLSLQLSIWAVMK